MAAERHGEDRRAAELAGAGTITVSAEQRQALKQLAGSPSGYAVTTLLAQGHAVDILRALVSAQQGALQKAVLGQQGLITE
jgi:hypothetical protein